MIKIGIADDHQLFLKSLSLMLQSFGNYTVVVEALNGKDLQEKMKQKNIVPDIMLLDVNMPQMDGYETALWLNKAYPDIKLVALSMNNNEDAIIMMIKAGCCSYLMKDTHPDELEIALNTINEKGYYNSDSTNINFRKLLQTENEKEVFSIAEHEKEFLKLACSDMRYKEIAQQMGLSERTIDGYRESLFLKFKVKSRVGLCLEAIRKKVISL
ncbi:transcriptional regulatory protein DegU [mine drainage metagenome]|uniref:Transcriptional regulatory protein DegU n=1 Tax=mine drainage metagenome TaxID=410659 RepID=A0A1J5SX77_9ZZZZ